MSSLLSPEKKRERNWSDISHLAKNIFAVGISLVVLVGGSLFAYQKVSESVTGVFSAEDYPGPGEADVTVVVEPGTSVSEIGGLLVDKDVIASIEAFNEASVQFPDIQTLQAGTYELKTKMKASDAIQAMLDAGLKGGKKFRVLEGLRLSEQVAAISKDTGLSEDELNEALKRVDEYKLSEWAEGNPEGFLFPDTYEMSGTDPIAPLAMMAENFTRKANEINLESRAQELGRSPRDVVIVASIIEAEVRRPEDRPKVARVLYNRLDDNQPLQLDTTVEYANNKPRGQGATTTDEERANPSPYNTYVHPGLPPGPISAPGKAALEAAANPEDGGWRYFVAINLDTGETAFADTFDQHQSNVRKFQEWCQTHPGRC